MTTTDTNTGGPALTRGYLLACLMEEAGEVVKAAGKCQRFGFNHYQLGYGHNDDFLAAEVGDLLGIIDMLGLDQMIIQHYRESKPGKVRRHARTGKPEPMIQEREK